MKANSSSASLLRARHQSHDRAIPPPDHEFGSRFALIASSRRTRLTARASAPPNAQHPAADAIVPESGLARENTPSKLSLRLGHGETIGHRCRTGRAITPLLFGHELEQCRARRGAHRNEAKIALHHLCGRDCIDCFSGDFRMHRIRPGTCAGTCRRQNQGTNYLRGNGRIRRSRGRRRTAFTRWLGASSWNATSTGDQGREPRHTRHSAARSSDR